MSVYLLGRGQSIHEFDDRSRGWVDMTNFFRTGFHGEECLLLSHYHQFAP